MQGSKQVLEGASYVKPVGQTPRQTPKYGAE